MLLSMFVIYITVSYEYYQKVTMLQDMLKLTPQVHHNHSARSVL
jgi:hypothetical protein